MRFRHSKKSDLHEGARAVLGIAWIVNAMDAGRDVSEELELRHGGRCGRCARPLTDEVSVDMGLGPECAAAMNVHRPNPSSLRGGLFDARSYMLSGKALLIATSKATGQRFDYSIRKANPRDGRPSSAFFVGLIEGQDHTFIGTIFA